MIPLSETHFSGNEWKYVKECLDTGWVSSVGHFVSEFEKKIAEYVGVKHAVATVNGTSALHVALRALGVGQGDEVLVPTLTFVATANAVNYCGAVPLFMDCVPNTLCLDLEKVSDFLARETEQKRDGYRYNKKTKQRIKAIIPVHLFGHAVDMAPLIGLCEKYRIAIVEDACESLGTIYQGQQTGSFGHVGCFSFNGNKIITTGGGGMVVARDEKLTNRIRHLVTQAKKGGLDYFHDEIGFNYRLSNMQSALGVAQLENLGRFIEVKRKNALLYRDLLKEMDIEMIWEPPDTQSNFWFYTIRVPQGHKDSLLQWLISKDIQVRSVWNPLHLLPIYASCQSYRVETANNVFNQCINLPCSVTLTEADIEFVSDMIFQYFKK
ncbi:MAG: LegC family aminotransferase [Deltaproteobacteria bacterium]